MRRKMFHLCQDSAVVWRKCWWPHFPCFSKLSRVWGDGLYLPILLTFTRKRPEQAGVNTPEYVFQPEGTAFIMFPSWLLFKITATSQLHGPGVHTQLRSLVCEMSPLPTCHLEDLSPPPSPIEFSLRCISCSRMLFRRLKDKIRLSRGRYRLLLITFLPSDLLLLACFLFLSFKIISYY